MRSRSLAVWNLHWNPPLGLLDSLRLPAICESLDDVGGASVLEVEAMFHAGQPIEECLFWSLDAPRIFTTFWPMPESWPRAHI